jgi:peptidoglycan/xylan/chitin deacetylase (PgdA/CDA1 family)|tara:strand:+ start:14322 stop:14921 length:600 start_codon:yes stop_codon:yes gene_type:complete
MRLEFSWDDGAVQDVRLAELLDKYGFKGTFYIPTNHGLTQDEIKKIAIRHEIGGHTETHPYDLKLLSGIDLKKQIGGNREYLKNLTGQYVEKFCYPRGRYDYRVIKYVKEAGFKSARTTKVLSTIFPVNPFEQDTTIHCFQRNEYNGQDWLEVALEFLAKCKMRKGDLVYHVWGHSWELDKNDDWERLEILLKQIKKIC